MKVEPVGNQPSVSYIDAKSALRPVLTFGKVVGLFQWEISPNEKRCSLKKFLCWCQFVFVQIIVWGIVLKYILVVDRNRNTGRLIPVLAIVSFHIGTAYVPTFTYFSSIKHFRQLFELLDEYQTLFEPLQKMRSLQKHTKLNTIFSFISGLVAAGLFCFFISVPYKDEMEGLMYPFEFSDLKNSIMAYLFLGFSQLFSLTHVDVMFYLKSHISYLIITEFKHITKKLKNEIDKFNNAELKEMNHFEQFLEKTRQQHNLLVEILEATNSLLKHYLFAFFAVAIPIICFVLYGVIRGYLALGEIIFCVILAHTFLMGVATFSITGAYLNIQAHKPLEVIMLIDLSSISNKTYRTISMFSSNLTGTNIGFRVYDLLTLDAGAILTLIGTFVTYAVVMLQFTGYEEPAVKCSGNGTFNV